MSGPNILGYFEIDQAAITGNSDGSETLHVYDREVSSVFFSGVSSSIYEQSIFLIREKDGQRVISDTIPFRVISIMEYTIDDTGKYIKSLIMKVVKDTRYFDRTFTGTSTPVYPFGFYVEVDDAIAIEVYGDLNTAEKLELFAANHHFIMINGEPYMYCRAGSYIGMTTTIWVPTKLDPQISIPHTKNVVVSTIMIYTKKAVYNNQNAEFAEKTLENILKKKYEEVNIERR